MTEPKINGKKIHATANKDDKGVMGRLFWYTVGGCLVPVDKLKEKWKELGLPEDEMPNDPRPSDVFKQATKSIEQDEVIKDGDQTIIATYIVETSKGAPRVRHVVRLLKKNEKEKPFDTTDVGEWELDEDDEIIPRTFEDDKKLVERFNQFTTQVDNTYNSLKHSITENDLRFVLKEAIHKMPYILLRPSGGVYFVPLECVETIEKFSQLLKWVQQSYGTTAFKSELWAIPIVQENRDLIYEKYQDDVLERINKIFSEITEISADPNKTIYPCQYNEYCQTLEHIVQTHSRYKELLDDDIESVKAKVDILKQAVFGQLAGRVKGK